jgi:hypothetical protein
MDSILMNLEVEAVEGELKSLREKVALYDKIFLHSFAADKVGNVYFICGELGEKDVNNMPKKIMVCPAYGVDFSYVYEYTGQTTGPEW